MKKVVLFKAEVDVEKIKEKIKEGYSQNTEGAWIPVNVMVNGKGLTQEETMEINENLTPIANQIVQKLVHGIEEEIAEQVMGTLKSEKGREDFLEFMRDQVKNGLKN